MIMISSIVREIWCWSLLGFKGLNLRYHILGIDGGDYLKINITEWKMLIALLIIQLGVLCR